MKRTSIAVAVVAAVLGAVSPASADDPLIDVAETCDAVIGPSAQDIDARPVAFATLWTCSEADFDH